MGRTSPARSLLRVLAAALALVACGPQVTSTAPEPATSYAIVDAASGECLQAVGASTAPGAEIGLAPCADSGAQRFLIGRGGGYGAIRNAGTGLCLEVGDASAPLVQQPCSGAVSQVFAAVGSGDAFTIFAEQTGLALSVRDGRIAQSKLAGAAGQQFKLVGAAARP
jgi:hypothetical protein